MNEAIVGQMDADEFEAMIDTFCITNSTQGAIDAGENPPVAYIFISKRSGASSTRVSKSGFALKDKSGKPDFCAVGRGFQRSETRF